MDELLGFLEKEVDTPGLNPASGGHLGYIPGGRIEIVSTEHEVIAY